ncbi:PREDICTED: uncharacterized protein LOC104805168 [Tarenaya hassleriana]|uniref:uncharacterized protein LOC104805168 n=1 Tax=Tarenaya hassleriana TaxID=28532 RepID=UPI00053C1F1D|nr:PREDICTED: uncharacterized protein LOC104805168 [Tarenaya hassleriana]XP_010527918.1 PREDICTED: uncharacterized protein LOC104805168 [Tarenaya hassleriana]
MGSLCCVAARPHESNAESRDCSVGPHEPYWRTNTSFSPPPSRWDSNGVNDGIRFYDSSASSNSHNWARSGSFLLGHRYTVSDGGGVFLSSPSDLSQCPQFTPPSLRDVNANSCESLRRGDHILRKVPFTPTVEGTSRNADIGGSFSSFSDSGDSESTARAHTSSHRNISSRRFFLSKPVHPLMFPSETVREASDSADACSWSSASSSIDTVDVSELIESENSTLPPSTVSKTFKCGLCDRFLSQRSPWGSHRIIRSGDMPVTGVLPCCHVFHAECLDQTTPKTQRNDPPCPVCTKREGENSPLSRVRNNFPKLKPFREDGPSTRPWGCAQVGDCVESALNVPPRSTMMLLNRNRVKKNLTLKGNSSKDFPGKLKKSSSYMTEKLTDQLSLGRSRGKEKALW